MIEVIFSHLHIFARQTSYDPRDYDHTKNVQKSSQRDAEIDIVQDRNFCNEISNNSPVRLSKMLLTWTEDSAGVGIKQVLNFVT